ncbi:MAG TPA: arginine deiminase-related protein [Steroidobacteraceae bacterium]|nr:arginine deiminase-related protein [Steroidobacteraceae bacterium]
MDIRTTQCAAAVMMIRPAAFDYNSQTAASNRMQEAAEGVLDAGKLALAEFDAAVTALRGAAVQVWVVADTPQPPKPDAVFPNNWVSWHSDGSVVLYPMMAPNRRLERRHEVLEQVAQRRGYRIGRLVDLSPFEAQGRYLEGTGSLVLDHVGRVAFACRSSRTDEWLVQRWAAELGYEPVIFDAVDRAGVPFYHTNVMLSIGARVAVVAADAIVPADRERVLAALAAGSRDIIAIDQTAVAAFAGNMLELLNGKGQRVYVLSAQAQRTLPPATLARLTAATDQLLPLTIPTIERLGGGSVRCMLAEVFSPA